MYRPTKETQNWQAPPGLGPWRDLTDDEHAALEARHGDLSRWYERTTNTSEIEYEPKRKRRETAGGND